MFSKNLAIASNSYIRSKGHQGHWHNQGHRPSIDDQHGERHRAMIELQNHLGRAGTLSQQIEQLMGAPTKILDQPDETLLHELTRNNQTYEHPPNAKIWIYEWRGYHDYVYFIISNENKVIQSAWYYSFE